MSGSLPFTPSSASLVVPVAAGTILGQYTVTPSTWLVDVTLSGADAGLFVLDSTNHLVVGATPLTVVRSYDVTATATPFVAVSTPTVITTTSGSTGVTFTYGVVPTDGYIEGGTNNQSPNADPWHQLMPSMEAGSRLSGTVSVGAIDNQGYATPAVMARFLLDGVPQTPWTMLPFNWSFDTTTVSNGTHVIAVQQEVAPANDTIRNGSRVYVVNNSGVALTGLTGHAVVGGSMVSIQPNSIAWGRVDVRPQVAYPISRDPAKHPLPTSSDGPRLQHGAPGVWWVDPLGYGDGALYSQTPLLVKNRSGDYHLIQYNPGDIVSSVAAQAITNALPAFDGQRGIATLTSYATLRPGRAAWIVDNNMPGWIGVDLSGRVVDVGVGGTVTTLFGPRSVAGTVQTNPLLTDIGLSTRVANGEKEYVGTGPFLSMPQDVCPVDDDTMLIADTGLGGGSGAIATFSRSQKKITASVPLQGVSGVWVGNGSQWATTPNGLYQISGSTATLVASIPNAYMVRGNNTLGKLYVINAGLGLFEVDPTTFAVTQRRATLYPAATPTTDFASLAVDEFGHIGNAGNIYYFQARGGPFSSSGIAYMSPGVWSETDYDPTVLNGDYNHGFKQYCGWSDVFGHYIWGLAIHPTNATWLATGSANFCWHMATADLGTAAADDPTPLDTVAWNRGQAIFELVSRDQTLGLSAIFGTRCFGGIGWTPEEWKTLTVAQTQAELTSYNLYPAGMSASDQAALALFIWTQRDRNDFP